MFYALEWRALLFYDAIPSTHHHWPARSKDSRQKFVMKDRLPDWLKLVVWASFQSSKQFIAKSESITAFHQIVVGWEDS